MVSPSLVPLLLAFSTLVLAQNSFVLFPWYNRGAPDVPIDAPIGFGNSTPISSTCANALNTTINCDVSILRLASQNYYGTLNGTETQICTTDCTHSLLLYQRKVSAACRSTQVFNGAPNSWLGGKGLPISIWPALQRFE